MGDAIATHSAYARQNGGLFRPYNVLLRGRKPKPHWFCLRAWLCSD